MREEVKKYYLRNSCPCCQVNDCAIPINLVEFNFMHNNILFFQINIQEMDYSSSFSFFSLLLLFKQFF